MLGYFRQPEATAECYTADGFFKTGDMGEIDEQGRLKITGRVKELFKTSKGKYVAPVPIENRLADHPKIEAVCVGGANQPSTFALVLLSEEARRSLADSAARESIGADIVDLMKRTNAGLDPHEQLEFAVVVNETWTIDNGFLTPTMKIRRNIIEKHYEPRLDGWYAARKKVIWEAA
jgi:long-subunit acyl-CoA synthetase (AMP-forming)